VFPFPLKLALKNKPVLRREIEMIITTRKVRLFTTTVICSLIGGAFAVPVLAQTAGVAKPSDEVVEVVITAQKRTERLKDVTVSASVVDNMALAKSNATDISDLNNIVPSVQLKGSFNGRVPMAMRGVSTSANEATFGLTSGVAVLIDGVPTSSDSMAANQLSDVSRVEVLKGPQSTLGGRAASAGVINIVTRRPTKTFTAEGTAIVTDDDQRRGEIFVSGPMGEKVLGSLSAFADHTRYPMQNIATGDYTTTDGQGARAKLLISPTDNFDITLMARYGRMDSAGNNFVYNYVTPGATIFGIPAPFLSQDVLLAGYDPTDFKNTKYNSVSGSFSHIRDNDQAVNMEWRLGDYSLTSTTSSQHETQYNRQDVPIVSTYFFDVLTEGHAPHFGNYQELHEDIQTTSQEFKIASPLSDPINFVAGFFYSDTNITAQVRRDWVANPQITDVTSDTKTYGLYARVNWQLPADWKLITGLRANRDEVLYIIDQTANNASGAFYSAGSHKSDATVGDISIQKSFSPDVMAYATYAKGYKPGAYNTAAQLTSTATLDPTLPEDIDHFELGTKGAYFSRHFTLNASVFHTQYKNYQIQVYDTGSSWPAPLILSNAAEAQTDGLELDTVWKVNSTLQLNFSAAFIEAKFVDYNGAPCYNSQTQSLTPGDGLCYVDSTGFQSQDLSGKPMPDAPKTKLNMGFDKLFEMPSGPFDYDFAGTYSWRSKANMQANQNPETVQDAFGILNLSLTARSKTHPYSLTLFVNNVTDQYYVSNLEDFFSGIWGTGNAIIAQPARDSHRYVGLRLNASF
jgi:iron complex outermembrane receptor protein